MLAERFQEVIDQREATAQADQAARDARDDLIQARFPELNTAFETMIDSVTGSHPRLSVVKTPATDGVTNHKFATLDKTIIEVRSTLHGALELIRFLPGLEFLDVDQFGVIRVESGDVSLSFDAGTKLTQSVARRGILMRGSDSVSLSVKDEQGFVELTGELLEEFLATAFIRVL